MDDTSKEIKMPKASMEPQGLGCGVILQPCLELEEVSASMEPQGLGCGVSHYRDKTCQTNWRFNGATGFRLWSL